jgi:hypothetical protein
MKFNINYSYRLNGVYELKVTISISVKTYYTAAVNFKPLIPLEDLLSGRIFNGDHKCHVMGLW